MALHMVHGVSSEDLLKTWSGGIGWSEGREGGGGEEDLAFLQAYFF